MANVNIAGAGHADDPFQLQILLDESDLDEARTSRGLILDAGMGYEADPQIRSVIIQMAQPSG